MLSDVRGQDEGVHILRRVVEGHLKSPLLLVGLEGIGRRFSVVEAAREAFSKGNPNSPHSKRINEGLHPDLILVQPLDDKDMSVDTIRELMEKVSNFPSLVSTRYIIIEKAEAMTVPAANALLKTLEEQPPTSRFFLLSEYPDRILPTIRSRCGMVRYRPLPEDFIVEHVRNLTDNPIKALVAARLGEGSVGLAYQFLASGRLTLRNKMVNLLEAGLSGDFSSLFSIVDEAESDLERGLRFLNHLLCDLVMLPHTPDRISNLDLADKLSGLRVRLGEDRIEGLLLGLGDLQAHMNGKMLLPFQVKSFLTTSFIG